MVNKPIYETYITCFSFFFFFIPEALIFGYPLTTKMNRNLCPGLLVPQEISNHTKISLACMNVVSVFDYICSHL